MKRLSIRRLSMSIALGLASLSTTTAAQTWSATMNGANEAPPVASAGTGFALLSFDPVTKLLTISGTFSGLTGTTTAAHVHCCTAVPLNGTAGVATTTPSLVGFPLGVTGGTYDAVLDLTLASSYRPAFLTANGGSTAIAEAALIAGMNAGTAYFNIHTTFAGGGEIRGFTTVVPEPSTVMLMAGGLALIGVMARRKVRITA